MSKRKPKSAAPSVGGYKLPVTREQSLVTFYYGGRDEIKFNKNRSGQCTIHFCAQKVNRYKSGRKADASHLDTSRIGLWRYLYDG